jgi:hypothetical protein
MDAVQAPDLTNRWRAIAWWVLTLTILLGMLAGVVALGWHVPTWSRVAAACAAVFGLASGAALARLPSDRAKKLGNRWWTWIVVGVTGPLLADAPDRVTIVVMSFLAAVIVPLLDAARRSIRAGEVPFARR